MIFNEADVVTFQELTNMINIDKETLGEHLKWLCNPKQ